MQQRRDGRDNHPRNGAIAVVGAGLAGLITAYTLIRDGFEDVQVLTRDAHVGGNWAQGKTYPGLYLNSVHGEYCVSALSMPPPASDCGRTSGDEVGAYLETFGSKFLKDKIQYGVEVVRIERPPSGTGWRVRVHHRKTGLTEVRHYRRVVLCTGGQSAPRFPPNMSPESAAASGFKGIVFHSADFGSKLSDLLASVPPAVSSAEPDSPTVLVVGGGKSAQDIAAYLANEGRKVTIVCPNFDAFLAASEPLPNWVRKSRLLSLFSPHIYLRTWLERFVHTTWLGKKLFDLFWTGLVSASFKAAGIPLGSPLRNTVSPFWHDRVNDEGVPRPNGFHALALSGKISVVSPAYATSFGTDGESVLLDNGVSIRASAIVLATGYHSSWSAMFDEEAQEELGLKPHLAYQSQPYRWDYLTLRDPPPLNPVAERWSSSIYRGIVPAKNIERRDFAVNGAIFSTHFGYMLEVGSHWISSYFLEDDMRLPATSEVALEETERQAAWLRHRYPQVAPTANSSHTSNIGFWGWPQVADDLLEDMGLKVMRSGGTWLTWPFRVVSVKEIAGLKEERDARRALKGTSKYAGSP
ncbi:FAD/NAD(P)-binding domain-containing protein [Dichomitus squalens]|uniref:FAD/NAD(P)-binding domain-containing protein n=1 Tax=Dichomitus squalens TaxID=114155 RepID=A0A4Q9NJ09_9APHY|nr:FAD/NAD(P)-binding domain-containing protein [Dichomitus squalens]TBU53540.1 FAD/NAD(P)-binding domain-containing protein [Dichomitus squalens]